MKFKELKKSLTEKIYPCYILVPENNYEDLFLKSSCISNITKAVVKSFSELNLNVFSTENIDVTNVINSLNTLPFLSDRRLVIIKEFDIKKNEKLIDALKKYLEKPCTSTVLLIDEKIGSIFSSLEKNENVCVVDCSRVEFPILKAYIENQCKLNNTSIEEKAILKLVEFTNSDMNKLSFEINKLINLKSETKQITSFDIEQNVTKSLEYQIFELTNALMKKDAEKALFIVEDIIGSKKNISSLLTLIANHFRRMFYVKINGANDETAKYLGVKTYALTKIEEQSKGFLAVKLKEILETCKNIDCSIKSGKTDNINAIYTLVFSILI